MKKTLVRFAVAGLIFLAALSLHAQWARIIGGSENEYPTALLTADDGSIILLGYSSATIVNGSFFLKKISVDGDIVWSKAFWYVWGERESWETEYSINEAFSIQAEDDEGFIIAGSTEGRDSSMQMMVVRLSAEGDVLWNRVFGGASNDKANDIRKTSDGGYILLGSVRSFGAGAMDAFVIKLDPTGVIEWQKAYGGPGNDEAYKIRPTEDGGYLFAGYSFSFEPFDGDFWVVKLTAQGDVEWEKAYGGEGADLAYSFDVDQDGNYVIAGETSSFEGRKRILILKLDSAGGIHWQKTFSQGDKDWSRNIYCFEDGGYGVIGATSNLENKDLLFFKLTSEGIIEWQRMFSEVMHMNEYTEESGYAMLQTKAGGYYVVGTSSSSTGTDQDILILKLLPEAILENCGYFKESYISYTNDSKNSRETFSTVTDISMEILDLDIVPYGSETGVKVLCPYKKNIIRR